MSIFVLKNLVSERNLINPKKGRFLSGFYVLKKLSSRTYCHSMPIYTGKSTS